MHFYSLYDFHISRRELQHHQQIPLRDQMVLGSPIFPWCKKSSNKCTSLRGNIRRLSRIFKYFTKLTPLCLQAFLLDVQSLKLRNCQLSAYKILIWLMQWKKKSVIHHTTISLSHYHEYFSLHANTPCQDLFNAVTVPRAATINLFPHLFTFFLYPSLQM